MHDIVGEEELPRIGRIHVHSLSHGRAGKPPAAFPRLPFTRDEGVGVMEDVSALGVGRPRFDGPDPPAVDEGGVQDVVDRHVRLPPLVTARGRNGVRRRGQDEVRRSPALVVLELPVLVLGAPFDRFGQKGRISHRHPGVHPIRNRLDCLLRERRVVLEILDPDRPVDVPARWHHPVHDRFLDHRRPGPHLLVGLERHRRGRARTVAPYAVLLEDVSNISRVGYLLCCSGLRGSERDGQPEADEQEPEILEILDRTHPNPPVRW